MESTDAELVSLRNRVDSLRKQDRLPYWRLSYAEFSLARIADYIAVDEDAEALEMMARLSRWVDLRERDLLATAKPVRRPISAWNSGMLNREIGSVRQRLDRKKNLIPAAERITFAKSLEGTEKSLDEGKFGEAYAKLFSLRSSLASRLHRSYRARAALLFYSRHASGFDSPLPAGVVVGPYNAEHTLESVLSLVGERDAIWVEDFLELYDGLSKITDRLAPLERKKR